MPLDQGSSLSRHVRIIVTTFMSFCRNDLHLHTQANFITRFNEKRNNRSVDPSMLRRLFPWRDTFSYHKHIEDKNEDVTKLMAYIKDFMKQEGYNLVWAKNTDYEVVFDEPKIQNDCFVFEKTTSVTDAPTWYLYFYSGIKQEMSDERRHKINKKIDETKTEERHSFNFETGEIYIHSDCIKKNAGSARIVLNTTPRQIKLNAKWQVDHNIVHYGAEEMNNSLNNDDSQPLTETLIFPINFYFKNYDKTNFNIGVYSSMINQSEEKKSIPICGLVIAVRNEAALDQGNIELQSLIHYLLRHKELKGANSGFNFPIDAVTSSLPEQAKIWHQDVRKAKGTYEVYFYDPYFEKFNKGYMNVNLDGTVILCITNNASDHAQPYIGVIKKINSDFRQNNLIISLSYFAKENEYRVRCLLTTKHSGGRYYLFGTYGALQFEQLKPFSSLFAAVKLKNDISVQKIRSRIQAEKDDELGKFEHYIRDNTDLKNLLSKIRDEEIRKFFSPNMDYNINSIALKLHPEI